MERISVDTLFDIRFVAHPLLSEDGSLTVFSVQEAEREGNCYRSDLYLLRPDGTQERLTAWGDVFDYLWTREGQLLFSSRKEMEEGARGTQTYLWDPRTGASVPHALLPEDHAQLLYGDGKQILYAATHRLEAGHPLQRELEKSDDAPVSVFDELPFWSNGQGVTNRVRRGLYRFDLCTGECAALTGSSFAVELTAVSGDGGQILYSGYDYRGNRPILSEIRLNRVMEREDRLLIEAGRFDFTSLTFWNDKALLFGVPGSRLSQKLDGSFYSIDLTTGETSLFAHHGKSGGRADNVASDARLGAPACFAADGDRLYFLTNEAGTTYLSSLNASGEIAEYLTGEGSCDSFDVKNGRTVVCGMYRNRPAELYEEGRPITHFNDPLFDELALPTPEEVRFRGRDGAELQGWYIRPAGYKPGRSYPAALEIHGGPRVMFGPVFHHEMQVLAAAGYFVLYCNPRGSDGYGDSFADIDDQYGGVDYEDLMAFVDHMLKKCPDIDPERLGVLGGSYGGFMTNWIIGHTGRFAAACSQRSTSDWMSFTFTGDMSSIYDPLHVKHLEDEKVARAWELSPLRYAPNASTPTLFIQADQDYRCYMCDALMMYSALRIQGVEARLCLFHGENHSLSRIGRPRARVRRLKEILAWFDRYLKPEGG